jgi:hypothetical protein
LPDWMAHDLLQSLRTKPSQTSATSILLPTEEGQ